MRSGQVLARIAQCAPLQSWRRWLEQFMAPREFEIPWDGGVGGRGAGTNGVPQGSPLSAVLFLVYMAPILEEMERRVKEEVGRVMVCFPSHVDDLHYGQYDSKRAGDGIEQRERMQDRVVRVWRVVTEVGEEQ